MSWWYEQSHNEIWLSAAMKEAEWGRGKDGNTAKQTEGCNVLPGRGGAWRGVFADSKVKASSTKW